MINLSFLAWIFWDPSREAFTIPYFELAIMWYGVLFALGFIIGYVLFLPLLKQLIWQDGILYARDISNWTTLADYFKEDAPNNLTSKLNKTDHQELILLSSGKEPNARLKDALLGALNRALQDPTLNYTRKSIEEILPRAIVKASVLSQKFTDRMVWFIVIGTVIGARLGHVFFYDWPYYQANPIEILMIRKGGLASHGGTLGVLLALILFWRSYRNEYPEVSFLRLIDLLSIPCALTSCCIRLGNFVNQEIVGTPTKLPWGVIFGHPAEGGAAIPRHPAQLYEAIAYFAVFFLLYVIWKKYRITLKPGILSGLFFIGIFGSRFLIEFVKLPQTLEAPSEYLQTGQILSIPFILLGVVLLLIPRKSDQNPAPKHS